MIDLTELQDSGYLYFRQNASSTLLIVFGSAAQKPKSFTFFRALSTLDCVDELFTAHDGRNVWYCDGVPPMGKDLHSFIIRMCEIVKQYCYKYEYKTIIPFGSSMGGYVALLFCHFMRNTFRALNIEVRCLALVPETVLFLPDSRSLSYDEQYDFSKRFPEKYKDINSYENYADEVCIIFGELCLVDFYSALCYKETQKILYNQDIKLLSVIDCGHLVAQIDLGDGDVWVKNFVRSFIDKTSPFIFHRGWGADYLKSYDLFPLLEFNLKDDEIVRHLHATVSKYPSFLFGLYNLGLYYEYKGRLDIAYRYFKIVLFINPQNHNALKHCESISAKIGV